MRFKRMALGARLRFLPKQTHPLAAAAVRGLIGADFPRGRGLCERWVRLVKTDAYGLDYAAYQRPTAAETGRAFLDAGYSVPLEKGSRPGDLLYKLSGSGGSGHVGIRLAGNVVAENSSVHWDGTDARGIRTLAQFGDFDLIIRLPDNNGGEK